MTEEQINIAIAESLGWTDINEFFNDNFDHPNDYRDEIRGLSPFGCRREIHDYTTSLDACAEFEKAVKAVHIYNEQLEIVVLGHPMQGRDAVAEFMLRSATAPQRCEAYLRVIGAWKESNQQPK